MVVISREELRGRVRQSSKHRKKISELLSEHAEDAAFKIYRSMSMHSCHFTHIAMVIWGKAHAKDVPNHILALGWQEILLRYAKGRHDSGEGAGNDMLWSLVEHGARLLDLNVINLIASLHPLDRQKLEGREDG